LPRGRAAGAAALFIYGLVDTVVVIGEPSRTGEVSHGCEATHALFHRGFRFIPARHRDADHGALSLRTVLRLRFEAAPRLEIHTFEDLKSNLVIVVMAVTFLGQIVSWNGDADLFGFGVVVALVIAALNFYLWIVKRGKK
jgi:hypothetical protein